MVRKKTKPIEKSKSTFLFGGMKINVEERAPSPENEPNIENTDFSLCDIDIPDRIVVKHSRKPRKRIIEDSDRIYKVLNKQLERFNRTKEWPETSDILCWWCCHHFEGSPKCVPTSYNATLERFKVTGNFCSWNCAKAFVAYEKPKQLSNLSRLIQFVHGSGDYSIPIAPPRYLLKAFGGTMDIEDFRKNDSKFELNRPNMMLDESLFYVKTD